MTKDAELCPLPSVSSFDIRNVTTTSVLIAWDSQDANMTGLKGFLVAYHRLDTNDIVKKFHVSPSARMFRLNGLIDDSVYLVCVITQGRVATKILRRFWGRAADTGSMILELLSG